MGRVASGEELGFHLEQWEALEGGGCGCTCGRGWQGAGTGEVAWRGVVEMGPQQAEAGRCCTDGVGRPAVGVSVGGELKRDRRTMSGLDFSGWVAFCASSQELTPAPRPSGTCVNSLRLLCRHLPLLPCWVGLPARIGHLSCFPQPFPPSSVSQHHGGTGCGKRASGLRGR